MNLKDIKPIEGFHVMEFIRESRKRNARETKGMTDEQKANYFSFKTRMLEKLKYNKPS
jgi:hypothetical protein